MKNNTPILSVSQLNRYIKSVIDEDFHLQNVYVRGEISGFTNHYRTGHFYFTVKDEEAAVKAVMFRTANQRLRFTPENTMRVICRGRISVFERDGAYQLYVDEMVPDGVGDLSIAFEQLKKKLAAEGLFDESRKKPVPRFPCRVGVITSPTGAAVRDIINILSRRFPLAQMVFCPVTVQGDNAAPEIAAAIELMNSRKAADVLIVGRGGGSQEDLWAFNEELTVRAVAASEIPVISAVGHETDVTLCDFAADLRAPTPSAAAELAVPDKEEELRSLRQNRERMTVAVSGRTAACRAILLALQSGLESRSPLAYLGDLRVRTDRALMTAEGTVQNRLAAERSRWGALCAALDAMNPAKVLSRGYAFTERGGRVLSSAAGAAVGDELTVHYADGSLNCTVTDVTPAHR